MQYEYRTISTISKGLYKEKGSRFIALAYPVSDEDEIKTILAALRKEYHDARHYCYAWCLGTGQVHCRANDDGEPANSAGKPILAQINANELSNILVVVIRYFGGVLLGVGGLIHAYREASADAIRNNKITTRKIYETYQIHFNYPQMNDVMTMIKEHNLIQYDQDFGLHCSLKFKVWIKERQKVIERLKILEHVSLERLSGD
ncbi:MAG: YigZ family protein [Bacteroidales bacterium]|nr:YigZ family protein [Bacteroidales bacterium]MBN2697411.1 YigZ family protein [Bacteroidales bacterium]